ncbi:MAG TPA: hypothetical protein VLK84_16220 [Longimicrobium sp.]|nr:hypothetical protein [Longimicrobium sp.]
MSDPTPLLVPMPLQALLVNPPVQNGVFQRWSTNYDALNQFQDPVPAPFANLRTDPPPLGVHLHWKLPAALSRGQGSADGGNVQFPLTPNRWIVVRLASTADAVAAPRATAWIIQSDYLGDDGSSVFANPFTSTTGAVQKTMLGRQVPIEEWQGDPGGKLFLRATGLADVTFTAYQPGLNNVYAFFDDTSKLPENTLLTYLVAGWFSDPSADPLATSTPEALNWQVLGTPASAPSVSIFHGLIYDVVWQTTSAPPRTDSDAKDMQVAVGYTAVDALAAIIATKAGQASGSELEMKLEALQYEMLQQLDLPDGHAQLEVKIRDAWFGKTPGGTRWDVVPVSQGQDSAPLDRGATPAAPPLTDAQAQWLAALNGNQRAFDTASRELVTLQYELFALWWKSRRGALQAPPAQYLSPASFSAILASIRTNLDPATTGGLIARVTALKAQVTALGARVPDPTSAASIEKWSAEIPTGTVPVALKPTALPSFFHPSDPVVLVAGITPPTNEVDPAAVLPCRTPDAAVTGVTVGSTTVSRGTGSLAGIIQLPATAKLPAAVGAAISALAVESFFVDVNDAASIVQNGLGSSDPGTVSALRAAMAARTAQVATIPGPLQASFAYAPWQQAWAPLYLQWQITWFPTVATAPAGPPQPPSDPDGQQDNWPFDPAHWAFDGGDDVTLRGSEYYGWTGGEAWSGQGAISTRKYTGRTFLTPQATFLLIRRLADYVKLHPDDADMEQIEALIQAIGESRFLSQSLSGFNASFVMKGLSQSSPPLAGSAEAAAIGGENRGVPMVDLGDQDLDFGSGTSFFYPVRGGFFQFERLIIVDAFGQVLDLLQSNGNATGLPANFFPIRGAGLVPDAATPPASMRRVRQAPRVVQPNRLDLRMLDAADDTKEVYYAPGADPVCGWLLPNHLDRSVAAYDAAGNPLGELLVLADVTGTPTVRWLAAPDVANPITDPARIANPHMAALFGAFTAATGGIAPAERVAAFRAFYQSIDETLWMVDPPGGQSDADLAVLIGRPLALVRAQVQYELLGRPAANQSWRDTLQDQRAGLGDVAFPIRLGSTELLDDGLIGYFTGSSYTTFNAVHPSSAATSPYVAPVAPGNYLALPFNYPDYATQNLSLLVDPHGTVHATTGILPTARLQLPPQFYTRALEQMIVTFRSGPVLTDPMSIRLPFPAEQNGDWAWIRHTGTGAADWVTSPILAADTKPRLADQPPHLLDGWLKFTPRKPSS